MLRPLPPCGHVQCRTEKLRALLAGCCMQSSCMHLLFTHWVMHPPAPGSGAGCCLPTPPHVAACMWCCLCVYVAVSRTVLGVSPKVPLSVLVCFVHWHVLVCVWALLSSCSIRPLCLFGTFDVCCSVYLTISCGAPFLCDSQTQPLACMPILPLHTWLCSQASLCRIKSKLGRDKPSIRCAVPQAAHVLRYCFASSSVGLSVCRSVVGVSAWGAP